MTELGESKKGAIKYKPILFCFAFRFHSRYIRPRPDPPSFGRVAPGFATVPHRKRLRFYHPAHLESEDIRKTANNRLFIMVKKWYTDFC